MVEDNILDEVVDDMNDLSVEEHDELHDEHDDEMVDIPAYEKSRRRLSTADYRSPTFDPAAFAVTQTQERKIAVFSSGGDASGRGKISIVNYLMDRQIWSAYNIMSLLRSSYQPKAIMVLNGLSVTSGSP